MAMDLEQEERLASVVGMINCGATGNFIHPVIISDFGLSMTPKKVIRPLLTVDGSPIQGGAVTHEARVRLVIDGHAEDLTLDVANIGDHDVILGLPWLKQNNPVINWRHHQVHFIDGPLRDLEPEHHPESTANKSGMNPGPADSTFHIGMIQVLDPEEFLQEVAENDGQFYALWEDNPLVTAATTKDIPAETTDGPMPGLPERYQEFADVFSKKDLDKLPPHRPYDLQIDLKEDEFSNDILPEPAKIYPVSPTELEILRTFVDDNRAKGFIRPSTSPIRSPVLFTKKKGMTELRLCFDYRALNAVSKRNGYPLPLIDELLDHVATAKVFTKIDLQWGYNNIHIREGDKWKAAFATPQGLFEPLVMGFGFTNAPACFQHFVNDVFKDVMHQFVVIYLDDILIFSDNEEDHEHHVRLVLQRLRENQLYANPRKCSWHQQEVDFLGYKVSANGIRMDPKKVDVVLNWKMPKRVSDVQAFIGFANFYRRFIRNFSDVAKSLTVLFKQNQSFSWGTEQQTAFDELKKAFTTSPVLIHPDPTSRFWIEKDP